MARTLKGLSESAYMVLRILAAGASYGYAIRKDLNEATQGEVDLSLAVIYEALHRLLEDGLIKRGPELVVDGRSRRTYEITGIGQRALQGHERLDRQLRAFGSTVPDAAGGN